MSDPYCFVLMPFGKRPDPAGGAAIDFDYIYNTALAPAIRSAGLYPYRDDASAIGGIVQKQIYEALLLCDFAVADLTVENSNVSYELGVRHAVRPSSTLAISANVDAIPFDLAHLRTLRYSLDRTNFLDEGHATDLQAAVVRELRELRRHVHERVDFADSPLFQLIEGWRPSRPESLKTDLFARRVVYNDRVKKRLARAREAHLRGTTSLAVAEVGAIREELGPPEGVEAGILVDLLLTYRAFEDWDAMCQVVDQMPGFLQDRTLVQEQLAFALNRRANEGNEDDRGLALQILHGLIDDGRGSSETYGLIGRIHKDRWRNSTDSHDRRRHLRSAIDAYQRGFRRDPTDPYPGVNAVTLLRISGLPADVDLFEKLMPVVRYAAERLLELEKPTYWMYATLLELAVLRDDDEDGLHRLDETLGAVREVWEPPTTLQNIVDILQHGTVPVGKWVESVATQLRRASDA